MGGLSEMTFLIDLASKHDSVGIFTKKIQDGGDIRVGRKFIKIQKFKNTFFSKSSSTFFSAK
jgi:hypothetical protein